MIDLRRLRYSLGTDDLSFTKPHFLRFQQYIATEGTQLLMCRNPQVDSQLALGTKALFHLDSTPVARVGQCGSLSRLSNHWLRITLQEVCLTFCKSIRQRSHSIFVTVPGYLHSAQIC